MKKRPDLIIPVDFDGTIVHHRFPEIGPPVPGAIETLIELIEVGHRVILWTCRSNYHLLEAVQYLLDRGVKLHGFNSNRLRDEYPGSPKVFGHVYIDDAALGCPTKFDDQGRRYVDWPTVARLLRGMGILPPKGTIPVTLAAR